jgi:hypothetical protein
MRIKRSDRPFIIALCLVDLAGFIVFGLALNWWLASLILLGLISVVLIFERL